MNRQDAILQYGRALKAGQRYYNACIVRGQYPYPQVLDEIFNENMAAGHVYLGLVDIPADQIVGTTTMGRRCAFAGNFMPLLSEDTEFGMKWISLCSAHLGPTGITDPIVCYEYMGRFYVTEGNKRVSVLKSFDAPSIMGTVTRIVPAWSDDPAVQIYYEFMQFYQLSKVYSVMFGAPGNYAKLQAMLGLSPEHVWTEDERKTFQIGFRVFKGAFEKMNTESLPISPADALLIWLKINPFSDLENSTAAELNKSLTAVWPDIRIQANDLPIAVSTSPAEEEKVSLSRILGIGKVNHLNIAFVHAFDPEKSSWTAAHEIGRKQLEETMGDRVTTNSYLCESENAAATMEQAISDGAQVIFATTPPLIDACRQIAARYPNVKVLNCSLSMPYAGVRTYYSRIHEAKFVTGAVSGAMAKQDVIGYVANYPIIGTIAGINAFALGARLTNPRAKIMLRWTCLPGDPVAEFHHSGVTVISNRDATAGSSHLAWEWGTYMVQEDGSFQPLASPRWNWGQFYEKMIQSIFNGSWDALGSREAEKAVNYWWGMSSGAIDVELSETLPDGVRQLAKILKHGLINDELDPFRCRIVDQQGVLRNDGTVSPTPEALMDMDWLADNIEGRIPAFEELKPESQELVRLLGLYRDQIQPLQEEDAAL